MSYLKNIIKGNSNTIQVFWAAIGTLSTILFGILSAAILSRYLNKTEYGTYKQILYVYSTFLIIFSVGLPKVYSYFLPRYSAEQCESISRKIDILLVFFGLLFSIFLFTFAEIISKILNNPELKNGLRIFSPIPLFILPSLGIESIFSTYKKTIYIAVYNFISRIIMLFFIVLPVIIFNGSYLYALYGWIISSAFILATSVFLKKIPYKNIKNKKKSILRYSEILKYSLPLVLASLSGIAIKSSDQFYISRYFGSEVFADFSNGFIELPFVGMITASAALVLMPIFSKYYNCSADFKEIIRTWINTIEKSAIIIYPILIFFIFYSNEIMTLLYSRLYISSGSYFRINLILNFFNIIIFSPLFLSMGKTRIYSIVMFVFALLIWITHYFVLVITNSPIAIAYNSVITNILLVFTYIYLASKFLKCNFFDLVPIRKLLIIIIHCLIIIIFTILIKNTYFSNCSIILQVTTSFILYFNILIISGKLLNIQYLNIYLSILK